MQLSPKRQKLSIPDEIKKSINCSLWKCTSKINHFAYKAVLLPCGGNACKECIEDYDDDDDDEDNEGLFCSFCENHHKKEDINMLVNPIVEYITKTYIDDLKEILIRDLQESMEYMSEDKLMQDIDIRFDNVEIELDTRIESIITGLHKYREDFKKEMDLMKKKYKQNLKFQELNEMKKKINDSLKNTSLIAEMNYESFIETHKMFNESKLMLDKYSNSLKQISINSDSKIAYKELVGELNVPLWKKLESSSEVNASTILISCVYFELKNMIIAIDNKSFLITYDLESERFKKIDESAMKSPSALCIGKNNYLYVYNYGAINSQILEFDHNFKLISTTRINNNRNIRNMKFDLYEKRNFLYMIDCTNNSIIIFDVENRLETQAVEIDCPCDIEFTEDCLFITSLVDYEEAEEPKQLEKILSGSNCIFVLNRKYEIIDKISFDNWLQPFGLSVQGDYILTTALELDRNKVISNKIYLYVIKNKEIVTKIKLDDDGTCYDMFFFHNTIFCVNSKLIKIFKLTDCSNN